MGVVIDRAPKCHHKFTGEGIEQYWGFYKSTYRRMPISKKWSKDTLLGSVKKCLLRYELTTYLVCKFVKRARRYIRSY